LSLSESVKTHTLLIARSCKPAATRHPSKSKVNPTSNLFHQTTHPNHPSNTDKDKYISNDRTRLASLLNIPIIAQIPEPFPPQTLHVQRALCTIQSEYPESLPAAFEAIYQLFWIEGQPIGELEVVAKGLGKVFGEERARAILAGISKPEVKKLLNSNTQLALEAGAFGVPFWVARDGEGREDVFFGADRVWMVVDFLGLGRGKGEGEVGLRALL
jgi:2-hydroxychromene-2-carboxylate isomerase